MAAVRTYGIPHMIEVQEIFSFNNGKGKLKIRFSGGITDPKFDTPATYSTANEFEQIVIENSKQFGVKVFRYLQNGAIVNTPSAGVTGDKNGSSITSTKSQKKDETKVYKDVETIGQATEVLLELGVPADELNGKEAVISAMLKTRVSFPNLKFN